MRIFPARIGLAGSCSGLLLAVFAAMSAANAQRCVAQGDGSRGGWTECGRGGGSRSITIVIEREAPPVLGPPIIRWVLPSSDGSSQTDFANVSNPVLQRSLADNSVTGWMLYGRGKKAEESGDLALALAYYDNARQRNNSPAELADIDAAYARISKRLFDEGGGSVGIQRFQKSANKDRMALVLDLDDRYQPHLKKLFDPTRTSKEYDAMRKEIMPLLVKRWEANYKLFQLETASKDSVQQAQKTPAEIQSQQSEIKQAESEANAVETEVNKKMDEMIVRLN